MPPKLWNDTVESHRRDVRDAILEAAARLVAEHGLSGVTMSALATAAGIGRATLYKYFSDTEQVFTAWHERQVESHYQKLAAGRARPGSPREQLAAMLETYAHIAHEEHGSELVALMSKSAHVARGYARFSALVRDVIAEGVAAGDLRDDISPSELATFCIHSLGAAAQATSAAAVRRLVTLTLGALTAVRNARPRR